MKNSSPFSLVFTASVVISIISGISFVLVSIFLENHIHLLTLSIVVLVTGFASFYTFSIIVRKFIYDKIKIIYKTISNYRFPKGEKNIDIQLNKDILTSMNIEVENWAKNKRDEIENLKKLENFRREFIGNISHELKTPIFNIQGYVLTLLDGAINDTQVNMEYLDKTEKNVERLIAIVEDLGIISQLESGEMRLDYAKFDIMTLTREIFEHLEPKANKSNIRFLINPQNDTEKPVMVFADKEKIRQVLVNLIDNSVKYGTENGRTKVSFYDMDENVLIEVSDDGIGIESNHISRLFERFYRVDKSRSRNIGGSGLGLAIVKHILESHQQSINVRSLPGVGSTFSFTLKKAT